MNSLKNEIRYLLAIKLSKEKHKAFSRVMSKICYAAFFGLIVFGAIVRISTALDYAKILNEGETSRVQIQLEQIEEDDRTVSYYNFAVPGSEQSATGRFIAKRSMIDEWGDSAQIEVAYRVGEPENARPVIELKEFTGIGAFIKDISLMALAVAIGLALFYLLMTEMLVVQRRKPSKS